MRHRVKFRFISNFVKRKKNLKNKNKFQSIFRRLSSSSSRSTLFVVEFVGGSDFVVSTNLADDDDDVAPLPTKLHNAHSV